MLGRRILRRSRGKCGEPEIRAASSWCFSARLLQTDGLGLSCLQAPACRLRAGARRLAAGMPDNEVSTFNSSHVQYLWRTQSSCPPCAVLSAGFLRKTADNYLGSLPSPMLDRMILPVSLFQPWLCCRLGAFSCVWRRPLCMLLPVQ